MFFFVFMQSTS